MKERELTLDVLPGFEVEIYQYKGSLRATSDSLELARDLPVLGSNAVLCELGSGHGPVVLCVGEASDVGKIYAVERQRELVELLRCNVRHRGLEERVEVVEADIREKGFVKPSSCDVVLMNPPYYQLGKGIESVDKLKREAFFEHHGVLEDFVKAAGNVAKPGGLIKAVIRPGRLVDYVVSAQSNGIGLERIEPIYSERGGGAVLLVIWGRRGKVGELEMMRAKVRR